MLHVMTRLLSSPRTVTATQSERGRCGCGVCTVWQRMEFGDECSLSGCSREQEKSVAGGKMTHQLNELREK